jgi:hypothetical protein
MRWRLAWWQGNVTDASLGWRGLHRPDRRRQDSPRDEDLAFGTCTQSIRLGVRPKGAKLAFDRRDWLRPHGTVFGSVDLGELFDAQVRAHRW